MIDAKKVSILLVEPDSEVQATVRTGLEPDGFLVLGIPTASEALGTAQAVSFDLVILDPFVPHARELVDRMMQCNPTQRVLFITDFSPGTVISFGLCPEGADIFRKPFTGRELNGRVRSAMSIGKMWREIAKPAGTISQRSLDAAARAEDSIDLSQSA